MTELMIRPQSDVEPYEPHEPYDPTQDDGEIIEGEVVSDIYEDVGLPDSQTETTSEGFTSYEQPSRFGGTLRRIADRLDQRSTSKMYEEAYRMNDKFDAKVARKEKMDQAKERISSFGRAALGRMKNLGLTSLGLGVMAGEASVRGVKRGYEASKDATAKFGQKVGDGFIAGLEQVNNGMDTASEKIATKHNEHKAAKEARASEKESNKQKRIEANRERANHRKEAALARKKARRNKWAARREGLKEYAGFVKEGFVETKDAAKEVAKASYEKAKHLTNEQKSKLGDLAMRARVSGEAAVDAWKNYPNQ